MSWNEFGVDPHLNFERKLKMMLHPLRILALTFCSKFQLIQDWFFFEFKFNYLRLFQKQRKPNFNVFQAKNAFQIATENSKRFLSIFENFHKMYLFLYPIYFSKKISSKAKGKDKPIR